MARCRSRSQPVHDWVPNVQAVQGVQNALNDWNYLNELNLAKVQAHWPRPKTLGPDRCMNGFLLFRKNRVHDLLQGLRDFFIVRQRLHHGDLTGQARRDSRVH